MIQPASTDIILLLKQLTDMLQPFALSNGIVLRFDTKEKKLFGLFRPDLVINDITNLMCNIISYTPPGNCITLTAAVEPSELKIAAVNSGINLALVSEIVRSCKQKVDIKMRYGKQANIFCSEFSIINDK